MKKALKPWGWCDGQGVSMSQVFFTELPDELCIMKLTIFFRDYFFSDHYLIFLSWDLRAGERV